MLRNTNADANDGPLVTGAIHGLLLADDRLRAYDQSRVSKPFIAPRSQQLPRPQRIAVRITRALGVKAGLRPDPHGRGNGSAMVTDLKAPEIVGVN